MNETPLILGMDTCSRRGALGLSQGGCLIAERSLDLKGTFSEKLLPAVDQLLKDNGLEPGQLDVVAVSHGPGSFTGLRIGLATAKGLVYTGSMKAVEMVSLEVLAFGRAGDERPVTAVLPARPGWVYSATYRLEKNGLVCLKDPALYSLDDWVGSLDEESILTGEGAVRHSEMLLEVYPSLEIDSDPAHHYPTGESVTSLGWARYQAGDIKSAEQVKPFYLQKSQAEERWRERHGV